MTKIMIVDDNKDIVETERMILSKQGYETEVAFNGEEFLKSIEAASQKPQVVLLDVMMPGLTTRQILEKIKEKQISTKIILVTVVRFSEGELNELMREFGIVDYIPKPFDIFDLVAKVKKHLTAASTNQENS